MGALKMQMAVILVAAEHRQQYQIQILHAALSDAECTVNMAGHKMKMDVTYADVIFLQQLQQQEMTHAALLDVECTVSLVGPEMKMVVRFVNVTHLLQLQ